MDYHYLYLTNDQIRHGSLTHVWIGMLSKGQPRHPFQGAGPSVPNNFWDPYLRPYTMTQQPNFA